MKENKYINVKIGWRYHLYVYIYFIIIIIYFKVFEHWIIINLYYV